jgi:hypothetical protein
MFQTSRAYDLQHHLRVFEYYFFVLQPFRMILEIATLRFFMHRRRFELAARTAGYTFPVSVSPAYNVCQFEDFLVGSCSQWIWNYHSFSDRHLLRHRLRSFSSIRCRFNPVLISGIGYGSVRKHLMTFTITHSESEELSDFTFLPAVVPTGRCRTVAFLTMLVCIVSLFSTTVPSAWFSL